MCTFKELLFQFSLGDLNFYSLVNLLGVPTFVIRVVLNCC